MTKKRRRRKPEQIVRAIQEVEATLAAGKSEAEVFQALETYSATWNRWKKQFGGIKCVEGKQLRELEIKYQRLKELLAEAELAKLGPMSVKQINNALITSRIKHDWFYTALSKTE